MPKAVTQQRRALLGASAIALNLEPDQSEDTVRFWWRTRKLASHKVGRRRVSRRADVAAFLGVSPDELVG